ncbi:unnamed protein product [Protopolystoma xenopodis]|uniref:RNA helicase n=1 Tax=Protopolystoma xenopodis TaxID=117903 RepID=A0A3S5AWF9_9PLAT|nr:unnamed protein product [Protopolystoma xenopodis]
MSPVVVPSLMPSSDNDDISSFDFRQRIINKNRTNKKAGGFQSMGLSQTSLKGVLRKGYKIPTPIQRKVTIMMAIPLILLGKDVVAMARTGSGKTAAFIIPMLDRLKIEDQFDALHRNPDIIVATPGRLLHIIMEMNIKLSTIQYVVFDEGDRLFEMGFSEQLAETLHRLPKARQTLIFSATLPRALAEFSRAGLIDPVLIRLDVDSKLSPLTKIAHMICSADHKFSILFHLIQNVVPAKEQIIVFFATKHHVEYAENLLRDLGVSCVGVHSGLDPVARNQAVYGFRANRTRALLVTDLAARGIDIPLLYCAINFHFPGQPKLFIHRVGRVGRAGRAGVSYSLVDPTEMPYLLDLFVSLGRSIELATHDDATYSHENWPSGLLGRAPLEINETFGYLVRQRRATNSTLWGEGSNGVAIGKSGAR